MTPSAVLGRMEKELRELWTPTSASETPKSWACTMNLVVIAEHDLAMRYVEIVDVVTKGVPARAIVVALDSITEGRFEGEVSAVCAKFDKTVVCSERLTLHVSPREPQRISSAVCTLLVPEMQTTVVWPAKVVAEDPLFVALSEGTQRIVIDSARTGIAGASAVARFCSAEKDRPALADLSWTRLAIWQELTARFFDSPRLGAVSAGVTKLVIRCAVDGLPAEAALFLGWLATRLDWKWAMRLPPPTEAAKTARIENLLRADGQRVEVEIEKSAGADEAGPLVGIAIEASFEKLALRGSVAVVNEEGETSLVWRLEVDGERPREQRVRLRGIDDARVLERTLHRAPADVTLTEALAFLGEQHAPEK